jgi:hypothetical protein
MKIRCCIAALLACLAPSAMIVVTTPLPAKAACLVEQGQKACGDTCIALSQCCTSNDCAEGKFCDQTRACSPSFEARPLINVGSGKCFAPNPPQGGNGAPIQQLTCDSNMKAQIYTLQPLGFMNDGCPRWWEFCWGCICTPNTEGFFIQIKGTGQCLDARDGAKSDRSVVQQWTCREVCTTGLQCKPDKNAHSMIWQVDRGDFAGAIKLKNYNSGLCLDVRAGSSDEFAQLQQYHCTSNNTAQNFRQGGP